MEQRNTCISGLEGCLSAFCSGTCSAAEQAGRGHGTQYDLPWKRGTGGGRRIPKGCLKAAAKQDSLDSVPLDAIPQVFGTRSVGAVKPPKAFTSAP